MKTMDFFKTIAARGLKSGRCKQLMEWMKVCDKYRSRSSLDLGQSVVHTHFSKIFFSETAWPIKAKFYLERPWVGETKVY